MPIDLHTDTPERLIAEADPRDLPEALQRLPTWDGPSLSVVDYLFNAWVLDICMRPDDREGLQELELALHVALERIASPPEPWRARWQSYVDLLEGRALRFTEEAEIDALWRRSHIPELMGLLLRDGEMEQGEIARFLRLSPVRVSQLLRHLEEHGLIDRKKVGASKRVSLTAAGRAALAARTAKGEKAVVKCSVLGNLSGADERISERAA